MRIIGAFAVAICCYLAGCSFSAKQKTYCLRLRGMIKLLEYMYERIKNSAMPMAVIFASFYDDALEKSGFLPELRIHGAAGFANAVAMLELVPECASELECFGGTLGTLCSDDQLSEILSAKNELKRHYDDAVQKLPAKQKVTKAVWGLTGALIGLLLI